MLTKNGFLYLWFVLFISCPGPYMNFELSEVLTLENIPGASGIGISSDHIYIIGDNSPYLYQLDNKGFQLAAIQIYDPKDFVDGEIIKSLKPDFEAMEMVKEEEYDEILVFGSGSKSPQRDIFVHITLSPEPMVKSHSLIPFYDHIRSLEQMRGYELNIEAVAIHNKRLLLFNRGKNLIFDFNYEQFLRFIDSKIDFPTPSVISLDLPKIGGLNSDFSGATIIPNSNTLLFTTSVEDTPNAYDDGEVLGSFICMIDLDSWNEKVKYVLIKDRDQPLNIKVESISVFRKTSGNHLEILMVTDSDGDESLLLKGQLSW